VTVRPATTDDYQAASSLLSPVRSGTARPSVRFGPQFSVAIDASQQVIGLAGLEGMAFSFRLPIPPTIQARNASLKIDRLALADNLPGLHLG
jgi:hypothetical protein